MIEHSNPEVCILTSEAIGGWCMAAMAKSNSEGAPGDPTGESFLDSSAFCKRHINQENMVLDLHKNSCNGKPKIHRIFVVFWKLS